MLIRSILTSALRFRLLVAGLAAGVLAVGLLSLAQMHSDVLPELGNSPVLEVQTEALGLSSQEVEQYVTVPMENNLLDGIMGVWDVRSQSLPGLSTVDLYFEPGTTMLHARQLVEERLTNAFSLPNVSKPPLLIQPLSSTSRTLMIGLRSSSVTPLELSYLARWVVKPRLSGVPGVANVAIFGQQDRQIQVQVDPARLAAHHITLQQVIDTAGNAQLVSPLSYLQGSAPGTGGFLDEPNQRLEIRPVLPLGAPRDLASVPVSGAAGREALGSVADVVESHQPMIGDALGAHGSELVLLVQKLPSASVLGVTTGVERALRDLRPALAGVQVDTSFFKPAAYVRDALHNLALALAIAALLGVVALLALLLELRAAFIAALTTALSLVVAALVLQWLGYTLNALVVLGLLLAAAVVVDDAVAGTWQMVKRIRERDPAAPPLPTQGVILEACAELRSTLGYATLIVLLALTPVFFAHGLSATYLHPMVLAFALAVLAASVLALTLTPALGMLFYDRGGSRRQEVPVARRIRARYESLLRTALGWPRAGLACVCVAGLAGFIALPFVSQPSPPRFQDRSLVVQWDGPAGASLGEMNRITARTIAELRRLPAVADAAATLGRAVAGDQIVDTNSGQIYVALKPSADYDQAVGAVRNLVQSVPGMHAAVSTYEADVQSGVLSSPAPAVTVRVYGESYARLRELAAHIEAAMAGIHGLGRPRVALPSPEPNVEVAVDDGAAHDAGVLPGDARRQASTLVSGLTVGNFFEHQAVFDVVVIGTPAARATVDAVGKLLIDTSDGGHVPLSRIAAVTVRSDPVDIQHEALSRYLDVSVPVYSGGTDHAQAALREKVGRAAFPLGYHAEVLGGTPRRATSHAKFLSILLAAALGMLLLLQAAFRSWRLAALFMLVLPVSLIGGVIVALLIGQAGSLGFDAGLLAVLALATRQGMVTVVALRNRHERSGGRLTASLVVHESGERFGSWLASLVVLVMMLIPFLFLGDAPGNEVTHVAAWVILGGLLSAAVVNQMLLPALCLAFGPTEPMLADLDAEALEPRRLAPTPAPTERR